MSQIESKGSQSTSSWMIDESISTRRFTNAGEEFVVQRQKQIMSDGNEKAREVLEIKKPDGTVEAYERTEEYPAYRRIETGNLIWINREEG